MLNNYEKFDFFILKKLLNLPHEKSVNIQGGHGIEIIIPGCQASLEMSICVLKTGINPNISTGNLPIDTFIQGLLELFIGSK